jgi:hypothetical protein
LNESPALSVAIAKGNRLSGVPEEGSLVNVGGRLMQVTKGEYLDDSGRNDDRFELTDIGTGTKQTFSGFDTRRDGTIPVDEIDEWAAKVPGGVSMEVDSEVQPVGTLDERDTGLTGGFLKQDKGW